MSIHHLATCDYSKGLRLLPGLKDAETDLAVRGQHCECSIPISTCLASPEFPIEYPVGFHYCLFKVRQRFVLFKKRATKAKKMED